MISFFEGDIANAIADTAAELDSVDVDFTHDCSDEGCSGTLATMLYKLIATGEDVLADIGGARSALTVSQIYDSKSEFLIVYKTIY